MVQIIHGTNHSWYISFMVQIMCTCELELKKLQKSVAVRTHAQVSQTGEIWV